jgi:hypothetical protein
MAGFDVPSREFPRVLHAAISLGPHGAKKVILWRTAISDEPFAICDVTVDGTRLCMTRSFTGK